MPATAAKRKSSDALAAVPAPKSRKSTNKTGKNGADEARGSELIFSGITDFRWASVKNTECIVWQFSRLSCFQGVPVSLIASSASSLHSVIVTTSGQVYTWGRGGSGQLGIGSSPKQVAVPTRVEALEKYRIQTAATGAHHTLVLTSDGDVLGFGGNDLGQLGIGNFDPVVSEPTRMLSKKVFVKISCGKDFSMIVDSKGYLYSCGYTEAGRLGHGFPKEIIEGKTTTTFENENRARRLLRFTAKDPKTNASKDLEGIKIVDVRCGNEHTLALDELGRIFSWGFGGFGRLGHGSPSDEFVPRLINTFLGERRTAKRIWAGGCQSFALSEVGSLNFWGRTKYDEGHMYPRPLEGLRKKEIHEVGISSTAVMAHADDQLFTWSFGSTQGEMALTSAQKSSAETMEVPLPEGVAVKTLVCGHSFTLAIVDAQAQKENKKEEDVLEKFPLLELKEES